MPASFALENAHSALRSTDFEMRSRHHDPHFHASYAEYDASISITSLEIIAGDLPRRQARFVLAWAELHQDDLIKNWHRAVEGRSLDKIEGLS